MDSIHFFFTQEKKWVKHIDGYSKVILKLNYDKCLPDDDTYLFSYIISSQRNYKKYVSYIIDKDSPANPDIPKFIIRVLYHQLLNDERNHILMKRFPFYHLLYLFRKHLQRIIKKFFNYIFQRLLGSDTAHYFVLQGLLGKSKVFSKCSQRKQRETFEVF